MVGWIICAQKDPRSLRSDCVCVSAISFISREPRVGTLYQGTSPSRRLSKGIGTSSPSIVGGQFLDMEPCTIEMEFRAMAFGLVAQILRFLPVNL